MINRTLSCILVLIVIFTSCSKNSDSTIEVDFLINEEELQSLGFEYDEDDYSLYKNDPDKVYFTGVNESVEFKDISLSDNKMSRKWYLDNEQWSNEKLEAKNQTNFLHVFDTPGLYKVKLVVNDAQKAVKFVRVLDKTGNSKSVESNLSASDRKGASLFGSSQSESTSGDIGDFIIFDFNISNTNPEKWEAIVLEDISETNKEITNRLWDFGDGTIIPTKGPKVKYSYSQTGLYEVKMCLNMTNNCKRKKILVSEVSPEQIVVPSNPISVSKASQQKTSAISNNNSERKAKTRTKKALAVQNLGFDLPEKIQAGLPVRFKDFSFPEDAINSRSWFIDGEKQLFHQRTINYIFDSPGTFEVRMCLNKKKDQCVTKKINVYQNELAQSKKQATSIALQKSFDEEYPPEIDNKKRKITYVPVTSKPSFGFMCQSYGKAGLKSKYKCTTERTYHYGNAIVNILPSIDLELQNAEIYGEIDGYMDVFLLDESFTEIGHIKNVQVLPGYSTIEFADLAFTLQKDKKYSILLKPKSTKRKKIGLENADSCRVPSYFNEDLKVEYQGKAFVMYDIKYCF